MTNTNTTEHDFTYTDTKNYTLIYARNLTQFDRKQNPNYTNRIIAILKSDDAGKERPYLLAWYYNEQTGEYECGEHFKTLIEAMDELEFYQDYICPLKALAHEDNCVCDFENCAWYVKDDGACAFTAQAHQSNEVRDALRQISEKLASIDDTLMCK